ncbi:MAG TPA: class I SAM-dependent methyltransferase, partial [Bryobacteraceae bacterium]
MSTQLTPEPDPGLILDYIEAFRRSKAMFTAVRLGVFDLLESRPQSARELAVQIKAKPASLDRLLCACIALGLLVRDGEVYRNAPSASRYLVSSSPHTFAGYVVYSDESLFHLWAHLDDAVREGSNRWSQAFGSRDALFDYYYRDPQATANFVRAMNG